MTSRRSENCVLSRKASRRSYSVTRANRTTSNMKQFSQKSCSPTSCMVSKLFARASMGRMARFTRTRDFSSNAIAEPKATRWYLTAWPISSARHISFCSSQPRNDASTTCVTTFGCSLTSCCFQPLSEFAKTRSMAKCSRMCMATKFPFLSSQAFRCQCQALGMAWVLSCSPLEDEWTLLPSETAQTHMDSRVPERKTSSAARIVPRQSGRQRVDDGVLPSEGLRHLGANRANRLLPGGLLSGIGQGCQRIAAISGVSVYLTWDRVKRPDLLFPINPYQPMEHSADFDSYLDSLNDTLNATEELEEDHDDPEEE